MLKYMMHFVVANGRTAESDILADERFAGNINQITWLTDILDGAFIQFITVIAFFIISAALLRNVIAGAYAAYPKFFDRINQAKQARVDRLQAATGDGAMFWGNKAGMKARFQFSGSSWGWEILSYLIPDFKSLSDFENDNVTPKQYWIVAIPQMFAIVMIGIMIYNGYYRDITNTVGRMGSRVITTVINNVHPVELVDSIFKGFWTPEGQSAVDNSDEGKLVNAVAKGAMSRIRKTYSDIKDQDTLTAINAKVESNIYDFVSKVTNYRADAFDATHYKVSQVVTITLGQPKYVGGKLQETTQGSDVYLSESTDKKMIEFNYSFPLQGEIIPDQASVVGAGKNYFVWVRTVHTKKAVATAERTSSRDIVELVLYNTTAGSKLKLPPNISTRDGNNNKATINGTAIDFSTREVTLNTGDNNVKDLVYIDSFRTQHKILNIRLAASSGEPVIKFGNGEEIKYTGGKWEMTKEEKEIRSNQPADTTEPTSTNKPKPLN